MIRQCASAGLASLLLLAGCSGDRTPPPPATGPAAAQVTAAEFVRLRWLEGRWRGTLPDGTPFFEAYYFQDDSTIRSFEYGADSTMASPRDSGAVQLRGTTVTSGSPTPRWIVTAIDSVSVTFADAGGKPSGFSWRTAGPGAWTATLTWDSAGTPRERVYEMRAVF